MMARESLFKEVKFHWKTARQERSPDCKHRLSALAHCQRRESSICCRIQGWYAWSTGEWLHLRLARVMGQVTQGSVVNCKKMDVLYV